MDEIQNRLMHLLGTDFDKSLCNQFNFLCTLFFKYKNYGVDLVETIRKKKISVETYQHQIYNPKGWLNTKFGELTKDYEYIEKILPKPHVLGFLDNVLKIRDSCHAEYKPYRKTSRSVSYHLFIKKRNFEVIEKIITNCNGQTITGIFTTVCTNLDERRKATPIIFEPTFNRLLKRAYWDHYLSKQKLYQKILDELDEDQRKVVVTCCQSKTPYVHGPPGSGKTKTLIGLVAALLKGNVDVDHIIVSSHTNFIKDEIRRKLNDEGIMDGMATTFYKWILDIYYLITEDYFVVPIADNNYCLLEIEKICVSLGINIAITDKFVSSFLEWRDALYSKKTLSQVPKSSSFFKSASSLNDQTKENYTMILPLFNEHLKQNNKKTWQEFVRVTLGLLTEIKKNPTETSNQNQIERLKNQYDKNHFIIDEEQDINPTWREIVHIVQHIVPSFKVYWFGDRNQMIFNDPANQTEVFTNCLYLHKNRRSLPHIIKFYAANEGTRLDDSEYERRFCRKQGDYQVVKLALGQTKQQVQQNLYNEAYNLWKQKYQGFVPNPNDPPEFAFLCFTNDDKDLLDSLVLQRCPQMHKLSVFTTIHNAKGGQWTNVFVFSYIYHCKPNSKLAANLLYVACSRAKDHLVVGYSEQSKGNYPEVLSLLSNGQEDPKYPNISNALQVTRKEFYREDNEKLNSTKYKQ